MVKRLILVLGDQLSLSLSALGVADPSRDVVVMAEVRGEAKAVPHHPQKIALIFAAMRHHAARLQTLGWTVAYTRYDDAENAQSISGELLRRAEAVGAKEVIATTPGDWRLIADLNALPLPVTRLPDTRFIASHEDFATWAEGRKELRMEYFYREMRRKTGILMEGDKPTGGKWNYDHDNREKAKPDLFMPRPPRFEPTKTTREVLDLVARDFSDHFGSLDGFAWPVTAAEAETAAEDFFAHRLACFGPYQDAMLTGEDHLYHALLAPALNLGLLDPLDLCRRAEAQYHAGRAPLNSVEGFIRQILGWREYVRGLWALEGPGYTASNALNQSAKLPAAYWGGETRMQCLSEALRTTRDNAYAHHIQRLMVTGNFALLIGADPAEVHQWYLSVYADAHEWVEAPNTLGMSQFADGGRLASKPYISSGNYINKMSDYCESCAYDVKARVGAHACPFNALYWHFLDRHRARFETNPRMGQMYRTWDRMTVAAQRETLAQAQRSLDTLDGPGTL